MAKAVPAEELASRRLHPTAKKILAAAKRILTERGYQGLTLQAISTEAGVNKAGVWYYFGGKEQLVLALLEEVAVTESHHFGARPAADATLDERIDLIVGSAEQVKERVERFAAFYELLPEASRDAELREHLMTYYQGWYAWAGEVLTPPARTARRAPGDRRRSGSSPRSCSTGSSCRWSSPLRTSTSRRRCRTRAGRSGTCSTPRPRAPADAAEPPGQGSVSARPRCRADQRGS